MTYVDVVLSSYVKSITAVPQKKAIKFIATSSGSRPTSGSSKGQSNPVESPNLRLVLCKIYYNVWDYRVSLFHFPYGQNHKEDRSISPAPFLPHLTPLIPSDCSYSTPCWTLVCIGLPTIVYAYLSWCPLSLCAFGLDIDPLNSLCEETWWY